MRHAGHVVTRDDLTQSVLGRKLGAFDRVIDVHASNLRERLTGALPVSASRLVNAAAESKAPAMACVMALCM